VLREAHEAMLPEGQPRRRGDIEPDRAVAQAKLVDAQTIEDATIWLKPKERMVVLHDRALIGLLATLEKDRPLGA
jgi:membrane glycosyltransferase